MAQLQCIVVTPEATVSDQTADFVALPLYDGELGVLPGHAPLIGRLGYGEMRIRQGQATSVFYVDGGFVEVLKNVVSVLTSRALPADKLDPAVAREQLAAAQQRPGNTDELLAIRERLVKQARAQLHVAEKAK